MINVDSQIAKFSVLGLVTPASIKVKFGT